MGKDTQIVITAQGGWTHKISKNRGVHEVVISRNNDMASRGLQNKQQNFTGKQISLDFQNVDVRTILQILAKESNTNIVASDSVQGKMTLVLKDVPWDQALALVLDARDLGMTRNGNVINIQPRADISKRLVEQLEDQNKVDNLAPLITRNFQLKYKKVEEFRDVLKISDSGSSSSSNSRSILSGRGSALIDPATNTLIVTDNANVIAKFERLIEDLDKLSDQVMVEARIVEAANDVSRDLGVKFGANRTGNTAWSTNALGTTSNLSTPTIASGTLSLVRAISAGALSLELSAMETDGRTKTIASPKVLTQDRKEATIKQGVQIPYTVLNENGVATTSFKDAALELTVTPNITPDRRILLDIEINKDSQTALLNDEMGIDTKQIKTQAMVEDGGTLVVGGVYQETITNTLNKVPLLGDVPVLGNLFKSRSRVNKQNEVLFFITPRIMGSDGSVMRY